jgi:membrane protein required for colicin V production
MISLSDITSFDVIVALVFLLFIIRGTWIGFMRQVAVFLALIGSYLLAAVYTGEMMPHVSKFIENPKAVFYLSFGILFVLGTVFMLLAGKVLRLVVEVTMTTWFDRMLGMILGVVKALFVTSLLYMVMSSSLVSSNELLKRSLTSPFLAKGSDFIQRIIQDAELRQLFLPKEPAILPEIIPKIKDELPPIFDPENDYPREERY